MKKVLMAFASQHLSKGLPRFLEQAESMGMWDNIHTLTEKDLDKDFKKLWGRYLVKYSRGYGYWCWKPYMILKIMETLPDGDILLYTDIGCTFNPKGKQKLAEYFTKVSESATGIMGVRSQEESSNNLPETIYYENHWTKADVFEHFGVSDNEEITHTPQFESTIIFFRKCEFSVKFVKEWYQAYLDDYSLATDSPSRVLNTPDFIENRHDLSIYSVLAKKHNIESISTSEIFQRDWTLLDDYPIHAKRIKAFPSIWHYMNRFKIRRFYLCLWKVKYFFKDLFCGVHDKQITP